jgi:transcriptional regulator with XRE-family HTH domain
LATLRDLYHSKGLTTIQVAALAGVSDTTIDAMNRKESYVKDVTIAKVCQALGISRDEYEALDVCPKSDYYRQP